MQEKLKGKSVLQKWQKDFEDFYDVYSTFVIDGYIDDLQPYIENIDQDLETVDVEKVSICDYFDKLIHGKTYHNEKNLLIVYDPTESIGRRFDIKADFEVLPSNEEENKSPYPNIEFINCELAKHFYEILKSDDIENQLMDHAYEGVSPDFAKIHYALSEENRIRPDESVFKNFFDNFAQVLSIYPQETNYIFVIKMISRLKTGSDGKNLSFDELGIFRQLLAITESIDTNKNKTKHHKLIILADDNSSLPSWFANEAENYQVKNLHITRPSDEYKEYFFNKLVEKRAFGEEFANQYNDQCVPNAVDTKEDIEKKEDAKKRTFKKFAAYSNDFSMKQLSYYEKYLENPLHKVKDIDKLGFSLANFKYGELKNPWEDGNKVNEILNIKEKLQRKLKGQDEALNTIQEILKRSVIGLDRIDNPDAPRVILFLAGPTGTGKTEVCKQLAEIIFGSPDRIVRFDMSEYGADESDQKLFGAPPGYVGYEEGGKLTNAVLKEPFSLILFDEIEKAHNSILDKFLQILSDGRLTSGKGETVSFTDSIIVITSNAGVNAAEDNPIDLMTGNVESKKANERAKMGMDRPNEIVSMETVVNMENDNCSEKEIYDKVANFLKYYVKYYFVCTLGRPELYGRIEDSIVYYNYMGKDAVRLICKAKVKSFMKAAADKYGVKFDMNLVEDGNQVLEALVKHCQNSNVRSMGARGIGKQMNAVFNGSLSNYISDFIVGNRKAELVNKTLTCKINADHNEDKLLQTDIIWQELSGGLC